MRSQIRIAALVSGGGTNLQAIMDACREGAVNGRVVVVGSDNPTAKGLRRAAKQGIETFVTDYRQIFRQYKKNWREVEPPSGVDLQAVMAKQRLAAEDWDEERIHRFVSLRVLAESLLWTQLQRRPFDLLVLAGFMRTLSPFLIDRVNADPLRPRIMNIHPALLPSFPGIDGYGDTFRYGCKVGGCTVHFIDYGEDSGPIIAQGSFAIGETDTLESVSKKGLALEWRLYPQCVQWFAEDRLRVEESAYLAPGGAKKRRRVVKVLPAVSV